MNNKTDRKQLNRHDWHGACEPKLGSAYEPLTFSVGVFQWLPLSGRKGLKKGKVKVRITGFSSRPEGVYTHAARVADELDAGTYQGGKAIRIGTA